MRNEGTSRASQTLASLAKLGRPPGRLGLYWVMLCYAMLCYDMLCYAMVCYAMLWHVMLRYAMAMGSFMATYSAL